MKNKTELTNLINQLMPDVHFDDVKKESEINVSQYAFFNNLYGSALEVAVHVAVASKGIYEPNEKAPLKTTVMTDDDIHLILNYDTKQRYKSKQLQDISQAIATIESKGIIKRVYINESHYYVEQALVDSKRLFYTIAYSDFIKLVYESGAKERVSLIAMYSAIATTINSVKSDGREDVAVDSFNVVNTMRQALCFKKIENLADTVGLSRNTANKYINQLGERRLIRIVQIKHPTHHTGEWANYYSKYSQGYYLKMYILAMIHANSHNEYEQVIDVQVSNGGVKKASKPDKKEVTILTNDLHGYNNQISQNKLKTDVIDDNIQKVNKDKGFISNLLEGEFKAIELSEDLNVSGLFY